MCGLTGVLIGKKRRRKVELEEIGGIFTELLFLNQARGKDAAGLAMVRRDGTFSLFKRPGPAAKLVVEDKYSEVIGRLDNGTTCILGHTRWKTRGTEENNSNNAPQRIKFCIGCHNGTITNADALFKIFRLPRYAEVDSELLFRLAARHDNEDRLIEDLKRMRGTMTAVFTKTTAPEQIYFIKGNKPLSLWYHRGYHAVFYSSEEWPLETVFGDDDAVMLIESAPFTFISFDVRNLLSNNVRDIQFKGRRETAWENLESSEWNASLSMERS